MRSGQTQIAVEHFYRNAEYYNHVWWLRSEDPVSLAADYANLAFDLDLPERLSVDQEVVIKTVSFGWKMSKIQNGC